MSHIFRAYDVRGVFNLDLDVESALRIGLAFGTYLNGKAKVCIGRDGRKTSLAIENAFISGLVSTGCSAVSVGMVPISTSNFFTYKGKYDCGAYITASHNPPEYNGVRFRHSDGSGYTKDNEEIKKIFLDGNFLKAKWNRIGEIEHIDSNKVIDEYIGYIRKRIKIKKEIKVVLDLGNSACALTAPLLFKKGGINVKTINSNIDGTFPGRGPNPTYQNLSELCENVLKNKADYGAAYDGDGDRVIFVDNKGRIAQTEKIGIILAREILKESKGNVLVNAPCSMIVEEEIEKFSGKVIRVRVGDVFVCEAIKKYGAVFGMEISAHFFIPSFYIFDDGVLTSYKLAEILSKKEKKLSELLDELPSYPIVEKEYKCSDETKFSIIEDMKAEYLRKGLKVDLIDGLKVIYDEGWIMVRASNTQPIIRLFAEAKSEVFLQKLLRQFEDELRERIR